MSDGETDEVDSRLNSASAFVAGYGSGYQEGFGYASAYRPYVPPQRDMVQGSGQSTHGMVAGAASIRSVSIDPEDVMTPRARPAEAHRGSELPPTNNAAWGSSNAPGRAPTASSRPVGLQQLDQILRDNTTNRPRTRDLPPGDTPGRQSLNSLQGSVSSWGTVATPSASARGSFSDLNLIGLPQAVARGDAEDGPQSAPVLGGDHPDDDEHGTPRLLGTYPPRAVQTSSSMGFTAEPRVVHSQGYFSEDERPRHLRSFSHPDVPAAAASESRRQNETPSSQTRRPQQHRRHTVTQSVSLDSGALPPTQTMGLGLTFDPSTAAASATSAPFAVDAGGAAHERIRAPAPRMGGPNVLTLWRS